jgi:Zn-dependent peptidase ImmA (M78 family)
MANRRLSLFELEATRQPSLSEQALIRTICERLLSEAEAEPPVPIERVASLRGIVSIEETDQLWAGMLFRRDRNFVVTVRSADGYERRRFTVCHEAGHTFFRGYHDVEQFRCNGERTKLEQRCDMAASELLLPFRFFVQDLRDTGFGFDGVEQLARSYEASIEATALRVADLWPEPTLLLAFRQRHKPCEQGRESECEPKLRLDYAHASGDWPFMRRHKSVSPESPFARALDGEIVSERSYLGEIAAFDLGAVHIDARRYGSDGRVLALVRRPSMTRLGEEAA